MEREVFVLSKDDGLWLCMFFRNIMDKVADYRNKLSRIGWFYNEPVCSQAFGKLPVFCSVYAAV